jgi:hypothetical protein
MNKAKIEACEKLCREFLERAKEVKSNPHLLGEYGLIWGGKETGALRRTSMELTRALADLRRAG